MRLMPDIVGTHFLFEALHRDPFWAVTEATGRRRCRPVAPDARLGPVEGYFAVYS
jgi:hypothetical protein